MDRWRPGLSALSLPFWDDELIRLNDAAFREPSQSSIQLLRERYGVRWLLVEKGHRDLNSKIEGFAERRFHSGDYVIYRVPDVSAG